MVNATLRSFAWSFLEQGGSKIVLMAVQIVLARILSPEAFGVMAILLVFTTVADSVAQSGLGLALIQKSDSTDRSYSTAWWMSLGLALCLYALLFLAAPVIAVFYHMPDLEAYLRILGLVVIFNAANSIQRSFLQRSMDFKSIFKATFCAAVLAGFVGIVLAVVGLGIWALVAQSLLQSVVICIVMKYLVDWSPRLVFEKADAKGLFGYGWKVCVTGILGVLYSGVSELVIGRTCSASDLGLYSQGRKYPQAAIGVLSNSIANVLFPSFAMVKNDIDALRLRLKRALVLGSFLIVPLSFLFAAIAKPLVVLLLTEKWLPCVAIFQLACVANSVLMLQLVNLRAYMALGNSLLYMNLQIAKVLAGGGMICATALLSRDIYATALAAFVAGTLVVLVVDMRPAKRIHGYGALAQLTDVAGIFVLSAIAGSAALLIGLFALPYPVEMAAQIAVFLIVYLCGSKLFHADELGEVLKLISRLMGRSIR